MNARGDKNMLENQLVATQRRLATLRAENRVPRVTLTLRLTPGPKGVPVPPELLEFEIIKGSVPNIYGSGSFPKR